ncbi:MFS transporter [Methanobacterium petrolearium]|uniref:MFS transporter n=1 Tax=Methanobacterium petrolearium TaxID=710190 RepID=UPI001AE6674D|nr:MFS transporter [Methanobacterium petrolearium]MBP1946337.1 MFS family permease [Methanobacterium petrolearium]BDZ70647.1 MFS transporter [Methanobacterium petrolearium]
MVNLKLNIPDNDIKGHALKFIILLGIVSLLADMTYEGARSITGPYLALLGANAAVVGFVAGFGELVGYALRFLSGYLADKTRRYWAMTIIGYAVNLFAVPLLALAGNWPMAALLLIAERMGKAIRTPSRDVMLSHATSQVGRGWGFGLHEAMDQIGAIIGPLMVAVILYFSGNYQLCFAFLLLPAILTLTVLVTSRLLYPNPHDLEVNVPKIQTKGLMKVYWIYIVAVIFIALGFADFPLVAYHFQRAEVVSPVMIPIFYSVAMGVDALAALVFGRLFDKIGMWALIIAVTSSAFFAPLVFWGDFSMALLGMGLWGVGMGAQESIMRAAVAEMSPVNIRGSAYGVFSTIYGISWFIGSFTLGIIYDFSITLMVTFSLFAQILAVIPLFLIRKYRP